MAMLETCSVQEAAKHLSMHPKTISKLCRNGKLPAGKFGGRWRIAHSTIDAIVKGEYSLERETPESSSKEDSWRSTKGMASGISGSRSTDTAYTSLLKQ